METLSAIKTRRSVRAYTGEVPDRGLIDQVLQAGLYAPSGAGDLEKNIAYTVILDKALLAAVNQAAKETAAASDVPWIHELGTDAAYDCLYDAPCLVLVSYPAGSPCPEVDTAAATENMLLAAEALGLGACWLYFPLQAFAGEKGAEMLKSCHIADGYRPYSSFVLGYKKSEPAPVPERKPLHLEYLA